MRCVVYEPNHTGHHFNYLNHLLPAIADLADEVYVVIGRHSVDTTEYREHLASHEARVTIDPAIRPLDGMSTLKRGRRQFAGLYRTMKRHRPEHLIVPYADGLSQVMGVARLAGLNPLRGGLESECVTLRGRFAYPAPTTGTRMFDRVSLAAMSLAPWTVVHHLDPFSLEVVCRRGGCLARRSRLIPEPVEPIEPIDRIEARRRLDIPTEGRYIGCAGVLDRRKGTDLLIRAFAEAPRPPEDRLLLVGPAKPRIAELLNGEFAPLVRSGRIVVFNRYVGDNEFATAMSAMDVVAACYRRHIGSSALVVRAPRIGRPLLGARFGWVGRTIRRFSLGRTCDVHDPEALARAITTSLDASTDFRINEAAKRFTRFHTRDNFIASLTARVRERLGVPPANGLRTWQWVNEPLESRPDSGDDPS